MARFPSFLALVLLCALVWTYPVHSAPVAEPASDFNLPRWKTGESVKLSDFAGQIVVLDFFAFWCVPCERASRELESGLQKYYASRRGNAYGIPVHVLSVNIEQDLPEQTAAYLRRTGASFVVNDEEARLLEMFGSSGIPFLVIIDGTGSTPNKPAFTVVYRHAGFEGVDRLRAIIDSLGSGSPGAQVSAERVADSADRFAATAGMPDTRKLEMETEFAWASDMFLTDSRVSYREERPQLEWNAGLAYASYAEEYRPFRSLDFFGFNEDLFEDRLSLQADGRLKLDEYWTVLAAAGGYKGYPNYRRVWIANRYRQKYDHPDFPRVPGYEEPNPQGAKGSLGMRWEYLPTQGFAEATFGYARDQTAPGYEDGTNSVGNFKLIQGRERLDTWRLGFSSENVLTRRLRTLQEFGFAWVSDRDLRFSYRGSANIALSERWILRGEGGVAKEAPQFDAWFVGGSLEYEITPAVQVGLTGRYYEDTGEIENSLPITSAAPPLRSWEAGLRLRAAWGRVALQIYVAPLQADYDMRRGIGEEFTYLYSDRAWGLARGALVLTF